MVPLLTIQQMTKNLNELTRNSARIAMIEFSGPASTYSGYYGIILHGKPVQHGYASLLYDAFVLLQDNTFMYFQGIKTIYIRGLDFFYTRCIDMKAVPKLNEHRRSSNVPTISMFSPPTPQDSLAQYQNVTYGFVHGKLRMCYDWE